jgi:hypothetical protein
LGFKQSQQTTHHSPKKIILQAVLLREKKDKPCLDTEPTIDLKPKSCPHKEQSLRYSCGKGTIVILCAVNGVVQGKTKLHSVTTPGMMHTAFCLVFARQSTRFLYSGCTLRELGAMRLVLTKKFDCSKRRAQSREL